MSTKYHIFSRNMFANFQQLTVFGLFRIALSKRRGENKKVQQNNSLLTLLLNVEEYVSETFE